MLSGILGAVGGVTVFDWSISAKATLASFVNAGSQGGTGRRLGNQDWSGSFSFHSPVAPAWPGATQSFAGSLDGSSGVTGPIIIDEVQIKWDIEAGKVIEGTTKFSGNGAYAFGSASGSTSAVNAISSIGTTVNVVSQVRTITLTIKRDNHGGAHSGTSGWINRRKGNLDATLAISVYVDALSSLPAPNSESTVVISYPGGAYTLNQMMFGDISGLKVDPQSAALIGCTLNASFDATPGGSSGSISCNSTSIFP